MSISKLSSWAFFGLSAGLLAFVVWSLFFNSRREGAWERDLAGTPVGELPVFAFNGDSVPVQHPAILYFFRRDCRFCPPAAERINDFVRTASGSHFPVFAITNEWDLPSASVAEFSPDVRVARLSRTMPRLTFIEYLPLLVRTDASGAIQAAYVGVPGPEVLSEIFASGGAGPVTR